MSIKAVVQLSVTIHPPMKRALEGTGRAVCEPGSGTGFLQHPLEGPTDSGDEAKKQVRREDQGKVSLLRRREKKSLKK